MTYKYLEVRREIYEKNPSKKMNSYRSISDIIRLFKLPLWIMLGVIVISLIALIAITIIDPGRPYAFLPMIIILMICVLSQIPRENYFYNKVERENELSKNRNDYKQYVSEIKKILQEHGINTPEKLQKLKDECDKELKMHEDIFTKINSKIVDMLIGVPLGSLIASLIYADSNAIPIVIGTLIIVGIAILFALRLVNKLFYYSEGYFKDKYLMAAINELDYL